MVCQTLSTGNWYCHRDEIWTLLPPPSIQVPWCLSSYPYAGCQCTPISKINSLSCSSRFPWPCSPLWPCPHFLSCHCSWSLLPSSSSTTIPLYPLKISFPLTWNCLPQCVLNTTPLSSSKFHFKLYLLQQIWKRSNNDVFGILEVTWLRLGTDSAIYNASPFLLASKRFPTSIGSLCQMLGCKLLKVETGFIIIINNNNLWNIY